MQQVLATGGILHGALGNFLGFLLLILGRISSLYSAYKKTHVFFKVALRRRQVRGVFELKDRSPPAGG